MKIGLTNIIVNDPDKAFVFYTKVLGFTERLYLPEARLAIVTAAEDDKGTGLLLGPDDNPDGKAFQQAMYTAAIPVIVFVSDDIEKEYTELKEKGVVFRKTPTKTEWGTEAIFEDTCGNLVQLHQV
ncbi:MAG: VOC family protein [Chitinophagaceae bacterium]